jgi:Chemoreceptor zinc-binding domain
MIHDGRFVAIKVGKNGLMVLSESELGQGLAEFNAEVKHQYRIGNGETLASHKIITLASKDAWERYAAAMEAWYEGTPQSPSARPPERKIWEDAIEEHSNWNERLHQLMTKFRLEPNEINKNNECEFGKWLETEGKTRLNQSDYTQIVEFHSHFHRTAADVLQLKYHSKMAQAQVMLGSGGLFSQASSQLLKCLTMCRDASS